MAKLSKEQKLSERRSSQAKQYPISEAFSLLKKELSSVKFVESVDVAINLGVDPRKSDQVVRGSTVLPKWYRQDGACCGVCSGSKR